MLAEIVAAGHGWPDAFMYGAGALASAWVLVTLIKHLS
jgi:hypothetical protein